MVWWRSSATPPQGDAHSSAGADAKGETFIPSPSCVTRDPQAKKDCDTFSCAANLMCFFSVLILLLHSPSHLTYLQDISQERGCIPPIARQQKCRDREAACACHRWVRFLQSFKHPDWKTVQPARNRSALHSNKD